MSITAACNVYNEFHALPGWLECASQFFDEILVVNAGPGGKISTDGTLDVLRRWKIPCYSSSISKGFDGVRNELLHYCKTDWCCILDADERFMPNIPAFTCHGEGDVLPSFENIESLPDFTVEHRDVYAQGAWLRDIMKDESLDAVVAIRRQWKDFTWRRPARNWHRFPDPQMRILRTGRGIRFEGKMHESVVGVKKAFEPNQTHGPFIEHVSLPFKAMAPNDRREKLAVYEELSR